MTDTLDIIKKHPLTGVGRGNFTQHIVLGERYQTHLAHDAELSMWKKRNSVPPLSALLGITAQYGIPLALLLSGMIARTWYCIYKKWRTDPGNIFFQYSLATSSAWCVLALIASMGLLDMRNPLFLLPLFSFFTIADKSVRFDEEYSHVN